MEAPLFSILIANYNNGRYLMEAIESVINQTYSKWEVIIVDDGSTDCSVELYKSWSNNERFHIFYNEVNKGCAYTKHQCVLYAHGEYCGFLDPDDVLLPNAIESSVNALNQDQNRVLSFSRYYECNENLHIVRESRPLVLKDGESYFEHHDYQAESFSAFRRDVYLRMGGLDVTAKAGVDADLYFRLEECGQIVILDEITYKYRRCSTSITSNWEKTMYWNLIIRHNTCLRRGLPVENYSLRDFIDFLRMYLDMKSGQAAQVLSSKAYKLGKIILSPFHWLQKRK